MTTCPKCPHPHVVKAGKEVPLEIAHRSSPVGQK